LLRAYTRSTTSERLRYFRSGSTDKHRAVKTDLKSGITWRFGEGVADGEVRTVTPEVRVKSDRTYPKAYGIRGRFP
jgi:hypothetical protein